METQGDQFVKQSAALRGQNKLDEAIKLIENNIDSIDPDIHVNAWLEAFYAAKEKGDKELTKKYAQAVANEDPDVPGIQGYV